MSPEAVPGQPRQPAVLSSREILGFYLPLVLTSQMMTLSVPLINLGLGRVDDPIMALAGYAVGFSVAVLMNAPVLSARYISAGMARDPASFAAVARFVHRLALVMSATELILALTPAGTLLFENILGTPAAVARQARLTLLLQSPIPLFLGVRGLYQGMALAYRRTVLITVSTLARLVALTAFVLILAVGLRLPGAASGAVALTAGIGLEAFFIRRQVLSRLGFYRQPLPGDSREPETPTQARILRFAFPLMLNHVAWSAQRSIINAIIARLPDPVSALAAFGVVHPLFFFVSSPLFSLQSTVQVMARHGDDLRRLARFTLVASGVLAVAVELLVLALGDSILAGWYGLQGRALAAARPALLWIAAEPVLVGFRAYGQGLLMRLEATGPIAFSAPLRLVLAGALGAAVVTWAPSSNGAVLGVLLILLGDAWDMTVACLWGMLRRRQHPLLGGRPALSTAVAAGGATTAAGLRTSGTDPGPAGAP